MKEEKDKKVKKISKKKMNKLKISDIRHGEGAHVGHLLNHIKAKEVELTFLSVTICLIVILTSLYFVFSAVRKPKNYNTIQVGNFDVSYNDIGTNLGNIIDLTPVVPMSDEKGGLTKVYKVKIKNTSSNKQSFQIKLIKDVAMITQDDCSDKQVPNGYIHYQINDGDVQALDSVKRSPIVYESTFRANEEQVIEFRFWVIDTLPSEYQNFHYHAKLSVKSIETTNR